MMIEMINDEDDGEKEKIGLGGGKESSVKKQDKHKNKK